MELEIKQWTDISLDRSRSANNTGVVEICHVVNFLKVSLQKVL